MNSFNLVVGALFGLVAVLGGSVFSEQVRAKLDADLVNKTVMLPEVIAEDGTKLREQTPEISQVDLQETQARWQQYQEGLRYVMYHALALLALGLIAGNGLLGKWGALAGGVLFSLGVFLYSGGISVAAVMDDQFYAIFTSIGALALAGGWLCLAAVAAQPRQLTNSAATAV